MMKTKTTRVALAAGAALLAATTAACGSSSSSASGGGGGQTITVGVLSDQTGLAASGNKTTVQGVQAGVVLGKRNGYTVKYVAADTQSSPTAALSAAQKLVTQDHVNAVVAVSSLTFAAASYLTQQHVPVVGYAQDGPEWMTSPNMFSTFGFLDFSKANSYTGAFYKQQGVTTAGALGYSISPSSADAAVASTISAKAAGLKVGYLNSKFDFGSTNVQPVALAMKNAGVDGITSATDPNTSFSLVTALRQLGDNPKVMLLPTGYGGDLLQAGPGTLQAAQGLYFSSSFEPVEMHTPATIQFQADLKAAGISGEPTFAEYGGYTSIALLMQALKANGGKTTSSALITALGGIKDFNAGGLTGTNTIDMSNRQASATGPGGGCIYIVKLAGSGFSLVPGADPICGHILPEAVPSS